MLLSELVTHASAEKCDDLLKVRKPTQNALHKGATLIIMVLFFLKHSTNLLWLGTSTTPEPSSRGKKRAAASDVDSDDAPSDDEKSHPITADVAMELKKTFISLDEIYQILARSIEFPEAYNRVRVPMLMLDDKLTDANCAYDEATAATRSTKDNWSRGVREYLEWLQHPAQQQHFIYPVYVDGQDAPQYVPIQPDTVNAYLNNCLPPAPPPRGGNPESPDSFLARPFSRPFLPRLDFHACALYARPHRYDWRAPAYGVDGRPRHTR